LRDAQRLSYAAPVPPRNSTTYSSLPYWYLRGLSVEPRGKTAQGRCSTFRWPDLAGNYDGNGIAPVQVVACAQNHLACITPEATCVYVIMPTNVLVDVPWQPSMLEFPNSRIIAISGTRHRLWILDAAGPSVTAYKFGPGAAPSLWEESSLVFERPIRFPENARIVGWTHSVSFQVRLLLWVPESPKAWLVHVENSTMSHDTTHLGLRASDWNDLSLGDVVHLDDDVIVFSDLHRRRIYRVDLASSEPKAECVVGAKSATTFGPGHEAQAGVIRSMTLFQFAPDDLTLLVKLFGRGEASRVHAQQFLICVDSAGRRIISVDVRDKSAHEVLPLLGRGADQAADHVPNNLMAVPITGDELVVGGLHGNLLFGSPHKQEWRYLDTGLLFADRAPT
jgi:hypothetical protein